MITSIRVKRYRGIKNCDLRNLEKINIFIGRNNSGKSSLLEALYLGSAAFKFEDPFGKYPSKIDYLLNRRCDRGIAWGPGKESLWHGYSDGEPIEIELTKGARIHTELLSWHPHPMIRVSKSIVHEHFPDLHPRNLICLAHSFVTDEEQKAVAPGKDRLRSVLDFVMERKTREVQAFMENFMFIDAILIHQMERVEKTLWNALLKHRLDKHVVQVLSEGYNMDVEDITYVPYAKNIFQLAIKLPRTTIRADDLGDGARYSMITIMIAALARNTAILIEEPENHQHPGGLAKSLEMFLTLAKRNNIQVFASTHSVEFLKLVRKIAEEKELGIATFHLDRDKTGNVKTRRITPQDADALMKVGLDPRFLDVI